MVPLGRVGGYSFKYFIKDKKFTKSDLISRLQSINGFDKYVPDDVKLNSLSRDFLITVNKIYNTIIIYNIILGPSSTKPRKVCSNVQ